MENVRPKRPLFPIRAGHSRFSCSSMSRGLMARFASNARGLVRYPCTLSHAKARGSSVTDVGNFPSRPSRLRVRLLTYHLTHQGLQNKVKTVHYCIVSSYFRNFCRVLGRALWSHAGVREGWYNPLQRPFASSRLRVRGNREYRSLTRRREERREISTFKMTTSPSRANV